MAEAPYREGFFETPSCPGELSSQTTTACAPNWWFKIKRIVFLKKNATNPFANFTDFDVQLTFDSFTTATGQDKPGFTPFVHGTPEASGDEISTVISNNGLSVVGGSRTPHELMFTFKNIGTENYESLMVSVNDNANELTCAFLTEDSIITLRQGASETPTWIPLLFGKVDQFSLTDQTRDDKLTLMFAPETFSKAFETKLTTVDWVGYEPA